MKFLDYIKDWINNNPGMASGGLIGFFIALFILIFGPIETLLLILFILIGLIIGKFSDDKISIPNQFRQIFKRKK